MKKLLLFAALFATAMVGRAQSFTVLHDGNPVENGSYVICTEYADDTDEVPEDNWGYTYDLTLLIENKSMNAHSYTGTLLWGSYPTKEQLAEGNDVVGECGYTQWGDATICNTQGNCFGPKGDNLGQGDCTVAGMSSNGGFQFHLMTAPPELVSEYKITITLAEDPTDIFECKVLYAPTEEAAKEFIANAGVNDIIADGDSTPVYYNLNGMKVANPSKGLYIVKRGSKVTKEVIR